MKDNKIFDEFVGTLVKMKAHPWEFCGVCTALGVNLYRENNEPKDFPDLLEEVLFNFQSLNRSDRRKLLKLCRQATKGRILGGNNGTED